MPDQPKSTPSEPEQEAKKVLRSALEALTEAESYLESAYELLPDPPDAEDMGEGRIPESLTFSLRGYIECALSDHLEPLLNLVRRATKETPSRLKREWQTRQRSRKHDGA